MLVRLGKTLWGYPALLLAVPPLMWAGNHVVGRAVAGEVPPGGLSVVRWVIASAVLVPMALPHLAADVPKLLARGWTMLWLALLGGALFGTSQLIGLHYTKALNVAVLNSVTPAFIMLASALLFRDRIGAVQVLGIAVSLVGVLVIISRGDPATLRDVSFNVGDLIITGNMALWAIYSACLRLRPDVHALSFMLALSAVSAIANIPLAVMEHSWGQPLPMTLETVLAGLYIGLGTSVIAYIAWARGIELVGPSRAAASLHLVPLFGAVLAWAFLGEQLAPYHIAGFALILAGVTLAARNPQS